MENWLLRNLTKELTLESHPYSSKYQAEAQDAGDDESALLVFSLVLEMDRVCSKTLSRQAGTHARTHTHTLNRADSGQSRKLPWSRISSPFQCYFPFFQPSTDLCMGTSPVSVCARETQSCGTCSVLETRPTYTGYTFQETPTCQEEKGETPQTSSPRQVSGCS